MASLTVQQIFDLASRHHQAGRLQEAERLYRQILAQQPKHAGAMHRLGVIAHHVGRRDIALDLIRQALVLDPRYAEAHNNLGNVLNDDGQLDEAIVAYRQAVTLNPRYAEAHSNLGNSLTEKGLLDEAIIACQQAAAINPNLPEAKNNLGNALRKNGEVDEAIVAYRQAITLRPGYPVAYYNLGNAFKEKGQFEEAIAAYRQAIKLRPGYAEAHSNLGSALKKKGLLDEAIIACRQAAALNPNHVEFQNGLGNVLLEAGQLEEAAAAYRRSMALMPNLAEAPNNLGVVMEYDGQLEEAIAMFRRAIELNPNFPNAFNNLGNTLHDLGQPDDAICAHQQALTLNPDYGQAHSNLLFAMQYHPVYDPQSIAEEHRQWNRRHAEPLKQFIQPHTNDRNPDRRLRIGYVSPDFREHPGGRNVLALLGAHDPAQVEIFCYANVARPDAITERIRSHAHHWRNDFHLSNQQLAEQIRLDQIDILVDLAGHTGGNRLLVFATKPAPVQVTWLGYPNTTGLAAMDYRLTDALADPPGVSDTLCSERLIRLPQTAWCFQAPAENLPLVEKTLTANTPITFGSFNNFAKITTTMLELWARILRSTPGSRLLIKAKALQCESVSRRVGKIMEVAGLTADRLELVGWRKSHEDHLAAYRQVDIALDTFPYHGTTTTRDALWMGVPVVTLAGQAHVSRVGVSLLTNVGVPELVAHSQEEYVQIASALARDIPRLNDLHATLRQKMEQSPLMDASRFARNFEAAYRQMWHTWCQGG